MTVSNGYRRHAQRWFYTIVGVSTVLLGVAVLAAARGSLVLSHAMQAVHQRAAISCGCATVAGASTATIVGGGMLLIVAAGFFGSALWRAWIVLRRTRTFSESFSILPVSPKLADIARRRGIGGLVREVEGGSTEIFCVGIVRPRMYVSRNAVERLSSSELDAVVQHEYYHLSHRDPLRILVADVAASIVVIVPWLRTMVTEYRSAIELAADEQTIAHFGGVSDLSSALLKLLSRPHTAPLPAPSPIAFFATTEQRIDHLLGESDPKTSARGIVRFSVVGIVVAFVLGALSLGLKAPNAKAVEATIGQCKELRRTCQAPVKVWKPWMSTDVELISVP